MVEGFRIGNGRASDSSQLMALTPSVLAAIGRGLAVRGEAVFVLDVNGAVELTQASAWKVSGGARPESWRYEVELPLPSGKVSKRTLSADAVLHVRYATRPSAPWAGISPLRMAEETRALATWIERRLAEEASTATFPMCSHSPRAPTWRSSKLISRAGRGRLHIVDTTSTGWGDGTAVGATKLTGNLTGSAPNPPEALSASSAPT